MTTPRQLQHHIGLDHTTWPEVTHMLRSRFGLSDDQIRQWRASDRDLVESMASEIERVVREQIEQENLVTAGPNANAGAGQPFERGTEDEIRIA